MGFLSGALGLVKKVASKIIPSGTVVGNLIGSTRKKGTGFAGLNIGSSKYRVPENPPKKSPSMPSSKAGKIIESLGDWSTDAMKPKVESSPATEPINQKNMLLLFGGFVVLLVIFLNPFKKRR